MSSKDSRRDPRSKVLSLTVRYKSATVADFVENHSRDVSRGGFFIETKEPFAAGTLLKFEVRIGQERTVIDGVGRVAWRRERAAGTDLPAGMGVKFIRIADECVQLIEELVENQAQGEGQFEQGAREQGVELSAPPPNLAAAREARNPSTPVGSTNMFPSAPAPAPGTDLDEGTDQSMLFQSSELLRAAVGNLGIRPPPLSDDDDITAEDRATLPTGASRLPPSPTAQETPDDDLGDWDRDDEPDAEDTAADVADEASTAAGARPSEPVKEGAERRSRSKRPGKRKNPKKKKKKFNYSSFPAPKRSVPPPTNLPQVDASSQTIPAKNRASYEEAAQAKDGAALAKEEGSQRWWFAAIALIAVAGVVYLAFFAPDPGKPAGETVSTSAPAVTAPQPEPPQGLPPAGPKLTATSEPTVSTSDEASAPAADGEAVSEDVESVATADSKDAPPLSKPAPKPKPVRRSAPRKPVTKPKPQPPQAVESATPPPPDSAPTSTPPTPPAPPSNPAAPTGAAPKTPQVPKTALPSAPTQSAPQPPPRPTPAPSPTVRPPPLPPAPVPPPPPGPTPPAKPTPAPSGLPTPQ